MDILSLGKTPIRQDAPTGEDTTYLPEFEEIQNEIDKLSVVSEQAGQVDWDRVLELGAVLLAEKSKNLLVAAYVAEALIKTRQFEGLQQGTQVLKDLVENYWDTLFPPKKRKKGRINALKWWYDRAEKFIKDYQSPAQPAGAVDDIKKTLSDLDGLLAEKADDAPMLRPLIQHVDKIPVEARQPEPEPEPQPEPEAQPEAEAQPQTAGAAAEAGGGDTDHPAAKEKVRDDGGPPEEKQAQQKAPKPAESAPAPPAPPAMTQAPESDRDAKKALNASLDTLGRLARYYLKINDANPMAYRLNRIFAWLTVDALPLVQEENKTPLPPPDPAVKSALEDQLAAGDCQNAVAAAETRLREHLFWLDLNRMAARGLEALGAKYEPAQEMICRETAMFVKRLPGLENLAFSDGTPFCDSQTWQWLNSITGADTPQQAVPSGPAGQAGPETGSRRAEIEAQAGELVKSKKTVAAVELLQEHLASCSSGRDALVFRISLCRVLNNAGRAELALPQLEALEAEIDLHGIESWEPGLALQGLQLVYAGFRDCARERLRDRAGAVFDRIARINPAAAFKISGI
jgi:type VI secretion system protein VasJ